MMRATPAITPRETISMYLTLVNTQLGANPGSGREWRVISKRLRASADAARKIAVGLEQGDLTPINSPGMDVHTLLSTKV